MVAKVECTPGELYPRVVLIVTNLVLLSFLLLPRRAGQTAPERYVARGDLAETKQIKHCPSGTC